MEFSLTESKAFYIDFHAKDDENEEWNVGELKNIFCGRLMVSYEIKTVCSDWPTIASVIPKSKFIGWGHKGIKENCYDYVVEQLRVSGYKVKTESWRNWSKSKIEKSDGIYQLFLEENVAGMTKGVQKNEFEKAVKYLKDTLKTGIPVMAGVDDDNYTYNTDKSTEHFVTIVGAGKDEKGKYFLFYDNAVGDETVGASIENKLYCDCKVFKLEGKGDLNNEYIHGDGSLGNPGTAKKRYLVTQIRETK